MAALLEVTLSWLLKNQKGRDAKAFPTRPAFADHPEPSIAVEAPACGPSGARLAAEYTADGAGRFPALAWSLASPGATLDAIKEWLLVSEDPDAPLPTPICHGIYTGVAPSKRRLASEDLEVVDPATGRLKGGFHFGRSRNGAPYIPPRPLLNHGPHRYFFYVVALSEPLPAGLLTPAATREQIADAIVGKVLGWGVWVGVAERTW
ncbi:PEBP-like protein [Xylariomycetidae sp. FL0641]|nr:PEBP-like protein [Xylariomycetidae sp. FL0641]